MFCHVPDSGKNVTSVFQGLSLSLQGMGKRGPCDEVGIGVHGVPVKNVEVNMLYLRANLQEKQWFLSVWMGFIPGS